MELTNLTLRYLLLELKPLLEGAFVNRVQEVDKEIYKFKLRTNEGSRNLVVCPSALYLSSYKLPAVQNAHGFGAFLNKHLKNKKILRIEQHESDRIAVLEFSDYFLVAEFLADFNIVLCSRGMEILQPLHIKAYRDRKIRKGVRYEFPPQRGLNPAKITLQELQEIFAGSSEDAVRTLIKKVNIAPVFAEELLHNAKINKHAEAKNLPGTEVEMLHSQLPRVYSGSPPADRKPALFQTTLLPFGLQSVSCQGVDAKNLNDAIDDLLSKGFLLRSSEEESAAIGEETAKTRHYLQEQIEAKGKFERAERENRHAGELIYARFPELQELVSAVKSAEEKKLPQKQIMYKLKSAAEKGNRAAKLLLDYNPKRKEIVVNLDDGN